MNKAFIALLVIVIGGLVGWYYFKGGVSMTPKQPATQVTESTPSQEQSTESATGTVTQGKVTVVYNDNGFSPAKITVKKGTTVAFENKSSGSMWVASDVHPTHQLLPGFDAKKGISSGAAYEYTFVKVGTWTYHNHLQPTQVGTVIVTE
jgi:plastocyanin